MGGSVRPVISLANRYTSDVSLIEIKEMEAVKIIVRRPSKDHLEDFVGIDVCLAWGAWQSWSEEVAHVRVSVEQAFGELCAVGFA